MKRERKDHKDRLSKGATSAADDEIRNHKTLGMSSKGKCMFEMFVIVINIQHIDSE